MLHCSIGEDYRAPYWGSEAQWQVSWEEQISFVVLVESQRASKVQKDTESQEPESRRRWASVRADQADPTTALSWSRAKEVAQARASVARAERHRSPPRERQESAAAAEGTHIVDSSCGSTPLRGTGAR